ncbi:MAG: DEAD/DEAH box helicase [Parasporobacterium sp.]|nr:DEAD/DEAH box helicase [Parasporobacterium sp.]
MNDTIFDAYGQEIELTSEQQACLKYSGDRTLMVKGLAGAGKSIVLMAIAEKYKQAYGEIKGNKVAVFTFQNTLVSTTKESLLENHADDGAICVSTVNGYFKELYDEFVRMGIAKRKRLPFGKAGEEQRIKNVEAALKEHRTKHGKHRFHDLDLNFWQEEFDWMKDMNVWTDDLDYYHSIPRTGRGGKVRMRSAEREIAYDIFLEYCKYLERTGQADWADQTLFAVRHRDEIPEKLRYEHVLIDEAQDLSLAQMTALLGVYKKDMTVAMDMNQRIHGKYWTPKLLGIETTTKKLTKSMRTTKQIDNLAESIRKHNDSQLDEDDRSLRAIPEREGPLPKLVHLTDSAAEKKYVLQLIQAYLQKDNRVTIGIIGSKNKQLAVYSSWLADAGIQHEIIRKDNTFSMKKPGVKVVTAFGAKGLEFNVVIIPMFAQGNFPYDWKTDDPEALEGFIMQMRNLVYVSMTRAKAQLVITYWGAKGSQFIGEMDPSLYELEGKPIEGSYSKPIEVQKSVLTQPEYENESSEKVYTKELDPSLKVRTGRPLETSKVSSGSEKNLVAYLKNADITVSDKRDKGGALWISGDKGILDVVMKETRKLYGAIWTYSPKRSGYFTKCTK